MIDPAALMFGTLFLAMLVRFSAARCCCSCPECIGTSGDGDRKFILDFVADSPEGVYGCKTCDDWNATWVIPMSSECYYALGRNNGQPCFLQPFGSGHSAWMEIWYSQNDTDVNIEAYIWHFAGRTLSDSIWSATIDGRPIDCSPQRAMSLSSEGYNCDFSAATLTIGKD